MSQIHRTSAVSKTLVFMWHKEFQDVFTSFKDGSRPVQPKTAVINANIAAVAGLITGDARFKVKHMPHSVGIQSG